MSCREELGVRGYLLGFLAVLSVLRRWYPAAKEDDFFFFFLLGQMFLNFSCQPRLLGRRVSLESQWMPRRECREVRAKLKSEETICGSRRLNQGSYFKEPEASICESASSDKCGTKYT